MVSCGEDKDEKKDDDPFPSSFYKEDGLVPCLKSMGVKSLIEPKDCTLKDWGTANGTYGSENFKIVHIVWEGGSSDEFDNYVEKLSNGPSREAVGTPETIEGKFTSLKYVTVTLINSAGNLDVTELSVDVNDIVFYGYFVIEE